MIGSLAVASYVMRALLAAALIGGGLSMTVVGALVRARSKQRTLASILDDTMGQAPIPVEVVSESPGHTEVSAITVRLGRALGKLDNRGKLERRLERAAIPFRAGEYLIMAMAAGIAGGMVVGVLTSQAVLGIATLVAVAAVAWQLPEFRISKRMKELQGQLPDALSLMAASVEGGQTFQRAIDMYRRDARPPLSTELDHVMAEVALGSDLVVALENMADRVGLEDLKWAVEAVRIQQSTGGRLGPILHTLSGFMRVRQEVRREVRTLTAEGRISGWVLFGLPIFVGVALEVEDPSYLQPMYHGIGLVVLIATAGLMGFGFWLIRRMVNVEV
ncbi:MAG TPA: type II secretion system F family protein [Acidimicrobiales bacterium]|nr:type II secretion system F family protein [Acidimicrobiales bacterium]